MTTDLPRPSAPRIRAAVSELQQSIAQRYPAATFEVMPGQDNPESVHLVATIDVEDTDEVLDLVIDRLLEMQVGERLPVHVIPVRPVTSTVDPLTATPRHRATVGRSSLSALGLTR